ncbi:hypothetical protein [Deinococcus roseus]|uniref:Uncharacterized protein n=1 Tax=Deinococcus roseus TaxID=392414 RepID=A0ABQ2D0B8_9DEIO|nr:hypothetical protein [Deinococcus roseus]GGJ31982.1 hypothetical protein GCM10008938_17710 [Deinococcus roseus]
MFESQNYLALQAVQKTIQQESQHQQDEPAPSLRGASSWFSTWFGTRPSKRTSRKPLRRA